MLWAKQQHLRPIHISNMFYQQQQDWRFSWALQGFDAFLIMMLPPSKTSDITNILTTMQLIDILSFWFLFFIIKYILSGTTKNSTYDDLNRYRNFPLNHAKNNPISFILHTNDRRIPNLVKTLLIFSVSCNAEGSPTRFSCWKMQKHLNALHILVSAISTVLK